jgi:HSP20 family molecular chaperone IbpA
MTGQVSCQDDLKNDQTHQTTKTNSYQSVTEQLAIPGGFDAKKISREYKDGVVTITVPKTSFEPKKAAEGGKA